MAKNKQKKIKISGLRNQKASSPHAKEALDDIANTADSDGESDNDDA